MKWKHLFTESDLEAGRRICEVHEEWAEQNAGAPSYMNSDKVIHGTWQDPENMVYGRVRDCRDHDTDRFHNTGEFHKVRVFIDEDFETVVSMHCDCERGKLHRPCAHLAAMLYSITGELKADEEPHWLDAPDEGGSSSGLGVPGEIFEELPDELLGGSAMDPCQFMKDENGTGIEERIEYARAHGLKEELKKELFSYIADYGMIYRELLEELRSLCDSREEWLSTRERIRKEASWSEELEGFLLYDEGRFEELRDFIEDGGRWLVLGDYREKLSQLYPEWVIRFCKRFILITEVPYPQSSYERALDHLKYIAECEGGRAVVERLVAEWRQIYTKRHILMRELAEAGF